MTFVAETTPYPYPFDGDLTTGATALIVCGAQTALVAASTEASSVMSRIVEVAAAMEQLGCPMFSVSVTGQRGLLADPGEPVLSLGGAVLAAGWDGCYGSDLEHRLRARRIARVALCGFASELTVDSTIRTLNDRGFECLVLTDLCAPIDPALGARALASVTMSGGIFGALGTSTALLDAMRNPLS
ncbi:MAG: cysteine hydrolase family protein [Acidimicrobiia bacterium]